MGAAPRPNPRSEGETLALFDETLVKSGTPRSVELGDGSKPAIERRERS